MIINKEIIQDKYFTILRIEDRYIELLSNNTGHCWIIQRTRADKYKYKLYHKHTKNDQYYHLQCKNSSFEAIIVSIKSHDKFVLKQFRQQ